MLHLRPVLSAVLLCLPVFGDSVRLPAENYLAGEIGDIREGVLSLRNPHAIKPLEIKLDEVLSVAFQEPVGEAPGSHQQLLNLINGDQLPCQLTGLTSEKFTVDTWYAGQLEIPRSEVASLHVGVRPRNTVFQGPNGEEGWQDGENWAFQKDEMFSTGQGSIAREIKLPEEFILSLDLAWESSPNFVLRLGGQSADFKRQPSDEYLIQYNNGGLQIQRHSPKTGGGAYRPIARVALPPSKFPDRKMTIELRVNRREHEVILFVNGEKQGRFVDPQDSTPTGNFLVLESRSTPHGANRVTRLEILEWDAVSQNLRRETVEDDTQDAISTTEGDRYGGDLIRFDPVTSSLEIRSPLAPEPILIPLEKVAVLTLGNPAEKAAPTAGSEILGLLGGGRLTATSLTLADGSLRLEHPVLGPVTIQRAALLGITPTPKPEPAAK